jgi:probable H4MPT-linked C1 transfer pathway protein
MTMHVLGLDIGGANLKAADSDGTARIVPFALWKHPERLRDELARLYADMPLHNLLAVTMTGELCDCFAGKREGVQAILQAVRPASAGISIRVWTNGGYFLDIELAELDPFRIAAANWLALAHLVALRFPNENVLLIDTGSTTTDIVYLNHGRPEPRGLTDSERLASGELVYTGIRRTPICAVLGMQVAAEFFATMLDAYLYAGLLPENAGDRDTADGRPATCTRARARLARMCCADAETFSDEQTREFARLALRTQWRTVEHALERVVEKRPAIDRFVVSGSGEILGRSVCARHRSWSALPLTSLAELVGAELSAAACAYAVAMLAQREKRHGQ